jgi:hypothetical protein
MTRMVIVELDQPGAQGPARAFLRRDLLADYSVDRLQGMLNELFVNDDDRERLERIQAVLRTSATVQVAVYPGEASPPEYHVFVHDPEKPEAPLFATVLAPPAVMSEMLKEPPHLLFETATFQGMDTDTSPQGLRVAFNQWAHRLWSTLKLPPVELRPWPIEDVYSGLPEPAAPSRFVPRKAPVILDVPDYPLPGELSA